MNFSYATVALPTLTPSTAVDALHRAGYRGVEWKVGRPSHARASTARDFLDDNRCTLVPGTGDIARVRELCADADLSIVGIAPYLTIGDVPALQQMIDMAAALGAPQVRVQAPRPSGDDTYHELARRMRAYLGEAERRARDAGLRVVLEMHQMTIAPSAALALALVEPYLPEVVGVIYDVGNAVREGYEEPALALELLGPHLHHVHLKNVAARRRVDRDGTPHWSYEWAPLDDGLVRVARVLELLGARGYSGWVSLEDLSTERDPLATLRHNAAVLAAMPEARWPLVAA